MKRKEPTKPMKEKPYVSKTKARFLTQVDPTYNGKPVKAEIRIVED